MVSKKLPLMFLGLVLVLLGSVCATKPIIERPQYTYHHYKYSILLNPDKPIGSPKLDLGLSMVRMEYPDEQASFLNEFLYPGASIEEFREQMFLEHRESYRKQASAAGNAGLYYNWRYLDAADVFSSCSQGIIIRRNFETYSGGEYPVKNKRYYVFDMDEYRQLKIDDFFASFNEERRLRDIVYEELRKFGNLQWGQPLSEGIFFANEPELSFNFFLTDEGLGLHWDPAQIAPYSEGEIEVILFWQAIRPLMLYTGIELLSKFDISLFMYLEDIDEIQP